MKVQPKMTFAIIMGGIFILIGVIGMIVIVASFDYGTYNELNSESSYWLTEEDKQQLNVLKNELMTTWVLGIGTLVVNLAIGSVLITLDRISKLLENIRDQK